MPIYYPGIRLTIAGNSTSAGAGYAMLSSGTLTLAGGNNITLSQNGNAVTIMGGAGGGGAAVGMSSAGNTAGTSGTFTSGTMVFAGGNNITLSQSTGAGGATLSIIGGAGAGGGAAVGVTTLGNTNGVVATYSSGTVYFVGGNNITLSETTDAGGATITIVGGAGGGGFSAGISTQGNTLGNTGTANSSLLFVGGNNITLSGGIPSGGSQTITIIGGAGAGAGTANSYANMSYPMSMQSSLLAVNSATSGSMSLYPINIPMNLGAEYMGVVMSMNMGMLGSVAFSQSGSLNWGVYSRPTGANSTQLSLMGSSSFGYSVTYNNSSLTIIQPTTTNASGVYSTGSTTSAGQNISSGYTGLKLMLLGLNSTITPGNYFVGFYHRQSFGGSLGGISMSLVGVQVLSLSNYAPMGSYSSAFASGTALGGVIGGGWNMGAVYSVSGMTALTNQITMSQLTVSGATAQFIPYLSFGSRP